jgi:hypothetical protein
VGTLDSSLQVKKITHLLREGAVRRTCRYGRCVGPAHGASRSSTCVLGLLGIHIAIPTHHPPPHHTTQYLCTRVAPRL